MFPTKEKIQPLGTNNLLKHLLAAKFKKKNNKGIFTYDCFEKKANGKCPRKFHICQVTSCM